MRILGVMSGSSLDGIDMALLEFDDHHPANYIIVDSHTFELPLSIKNALPEILTADLMQYSVIQSKYTDFIATMINKFLQNHQDCNVVSIHGHTVLHLPELMESWQMINAGKLSSLIRRTVVSDFRNQDLGAGGIGTPMAALLDRDLFFDYTFCVNLGGIANISYNHKGSWMAYDICPCNQVHNFLASQLGYEMDKNGELASRGQLIPELVDKLKSIDYIIAKPPKSIDNQWIKKEWIPVIEGFDVSYEDKLFSHYYFITDALAEVYSLFSGRMLLTGGGAKNIFFMDMLGAKVTRSEDLIVAEDNITDYKECILMAYMAYKRLKKENNFIAEATGAQNSTCSGAVYWYNAQAIK